MRLAQRDRVKLDLRDTIHGEAFPTAACGNGVENLKMRSACKFRACGFQTEALKALPLIPAVSMFFRSFASPKLLIIRCTNRKSKQGRMQVSTETPINVTNKCHFYSPDTMNCPFGLNDASRLPPPSTGCNSNVCNCKEQSRCDPSGSKPFGVPFKGIIAKGLGALTRMRLKIRVESDI